MRLTRQPACYKPHPMNNTPDTPVLLEVASQSTRPREERAKAPTAIINRPPCVPTCRGKSPRRVGLIRELQIAVSIGIALIGQCKQLGSHPTRRNTIHIPTAPLLASCNQPPNTFPSHRVIPIRSSTLAYG
ncbi:hypothetical protein RSOLAG1IB_10592 [Rhizoctonia solani AG-1 IB]|uniref:Uncharacterized protein n=1 Tax=Thanatephorus cucumeris (strain AG1-IB / isolate 7/3/14) TaxID=1108050 RepID=A0A0B7FYZ8_THACB|nr:hypothetical protein RSOLAG1IB_10592 [Rhizoctonia solani AG-1 IB]